MRTQPSRLVSYGMDVKCATENETIASSISVYNDEDRFDAGFWVSFVNEMKYLEPSLNACIIPNVISSKS